MTTATRTHRHQLLGQGNHSRVFHRPGSRVVLQRFLPDAPELTVEKVQREYLYLRKIFDPVLPDLIPDQRLFLPHPRADLAEAVMIKDFVAVAPGHGLRELHAGQIPRRAHQELAVFVTTVRALLADTAPQPALGAEASLIPDIIDPPLDNLVIDSDGRLRLLDTNRLISTLELRRTEEAGAVLSPDRTDVPARIFRLVFRRLAWLQHRFLGASATDLRADPLLRRYLHPTDITALFAASAAAGEPIND